MSPDDLQVALGLASVLIIPAAGTIFRLIQKVNRHDVVMEEMKDGIDRVESKVDLLTEVILTRNLGEGARKGRG